MTSYLVLKYNNKIQIRNENINCIHRMKSLEAKQEIEELMHKKNV